MPRNTVRLSLFAVYVKIAESSLFTARLHGHRRKVTVSAETIVQAYLKILNAWRKGCRYVRLFSIREELTMSTSVEELAQQIASLKESDLQALLARVEELSLRQEVRLMSDRYRKRLKEQNKLSEGAEEILKKLKLIREEIASREYPG
jgi:hypothetical protein